jgi:hypothetical protein
LVGWSLRTRKRVHLGSVVEDGWRVVGMGWEGDVFVLNVVVCEGGKP